MGRALTGDMPRDSSVEDFKVYTAGVSTFVRRRGGEGEGVREDGEEVGDGGELAPGTEVLLDGGVKVPDWKGGKGVAGGWECVRNGDCGFLSGGAERGWYVLFSLFIYHNIRFCLGVVWYGGWLLTVRWYRHFDGDESFDTGPMAGPSATPTSSVESSVEADLGGSKL